MCRGRGFLGSILMVTAVPAAAAQPATRPPAASVQDDLARRPSTEELTRRLQRGDSILLESGAFDPLTEAPPGGATAAPVRGDEGTFLVQFHRDLNESDRLAFERAGVRFVDHVPSHAYVLRASPAAFAHLRWHPLVRWLDAFRGEHKVPGVLRSDAWTEPVHVDVRLLPGEDPFALLDRLRSADQAVQLAAVHGEISRGATLRVLVPPQRVRTVAERAASDTAVWSLSPWYLPEIHNDDSIWVQQSYDTVHKRTYDFSAPIWRHGITGVGQRIAISDSGLDSDMCFFRYSSQASQVTHAQSPALPRTGTIDLTKRVAAYYVMPHATAYDGNASCGGVPASYHGTHTSSTIAGDNYAFFAQPPLAGHDIGDGMAPHAKLIFQDVGNDSTGCLEGLANDFRLIARQAYDAGARVHSNSWGSDTNGIYTSFSQTVDEIAYDLEDLLFVFSAGNAGPVGITVGSPATAKNCLAVGATGHGGSNEVATYSSRGPAWDGRMKPDLVAPGGSIVSAAGDSSHTTNNCAFKPLTGTSMAAAAVAGGAALLRQYFTNGFYPSGVKTAADAMAPSAALLRAALINGAIDVAATSQDTMLDRTGFDTYTQGLGRIHLDNVAFFATPTRDARRTRVWDRWNADGLSTGEVDTYSLQVAAGRALKVVLTWTDPPGTLLGFPNRVNNLDLEVVDPTNTVYPGNRLSSGISIPDNWTDALNTVEVVFLPSPVEGLWTLRVKASAVPGTTSEPDSTRQGYALVATYGDCTASLAAPGNLAAMDLGSEGIGLAWSAVPGATGYQVYRAAGSCGAAASTFRYVGQTTGTSFTDPVQGGAYKVRAVTSCHEGPLSTCASGTDLRVTSTGVVSDRCTGGGSGDGNGTAEAGEDVDLSVTLENLGQQTLTGLTGTLTTSVPGVVITQPTVSFPPVASGSTVVSNAPHFGLWVQPDVPCGATIPLTLALEASEGSFSPVLGLAVGSGTPCSQLVCSDALPAENGTGSGMLRAAKTGSGDPIQLTFNLSCHASDSTVYWGQALGAMTGITWNQAACGFGPRGSASVALGAPPPGHLFYFVVVPSNGLHQGSYGRSSLGVERPSGSAVPACNLPRNLAGTCP